MDISSSLSNFISALRPKIKTFWQQTCSSLKKLKALLATLLISILANAKIALQAFLVFIKFTVRQTDNLIDYLAHHPLLDKLET